MNRILIANRLELPSGRVIRSMHRHDYVTAEEDGVKYMVDGGLEYLRRSLAGKDASIYADAPYPIVRTYLSWGSFGPKGDRPLAWVALKYMDKEHIEAVLAEPFKLDPWRVYYMEQELEFRNGNIAIEDVVGWHDAERIRNELSSGVLQSSSEGESAPEGREEDSEGLCGED